jgi:hypothetical protein
MSEKTQNITTEDVQVVESSDANVTEKTVKSTSNEDLKKEYEKVDNLVTKEEYNSTDEESYEEDVEEELDIDFDGLSLKEGTELYVVTIDGVPQCYTKTVQEARSRMWDFARVRRFRETQFNTYIRECRNPNDIEVVGYNRFSIINIDRTICWLSVCSVQQVKEQTYDKTDEEQMEEKEQIHPTGLMASIFG